MKSNTVRRALALAIAAGGMTVLASEDLRCVNCGFCSSSGTACGMCQVEFVQGCCSSWTNTAYAVCSNGQVTAFCQGPGGPIVFC